MPVMQIRIKRKEENKTRREREERIETKRITDLIIEDKKEQGVQVIALFDRERPFCKTSREVRHVIQRADRSVVSLVVLINGCRFVALLHDYNGNLASPFFHALPGINSDYRNKNLSKFIFYVNAFLLVEKYK